MVQFCVIMLFAIPIYAFFCGITYCASEHMNPPATADYVHWYNSVCWPATLPFLLGIAMMSLFTERKKNG